MKPKILIIDDEIHIVELIRFNLETSGYEVEGLHDANHSIGKVLVALEVATYL